MIKRLFMGVVGLVLIVSGIRLMTSNPNWILDLLLSGASVVGAGLVFKALVGGKED